MTTLTVSVIIVSRGRPQLLKRCIQAVSQLYYHPFEIVVVADALGLEAIKNSDISIELKTALFEEPNISKARNIGLAHAAGEVVAFIDDDAVPEPGWLYHLAAVFQHSNVSAATGYVLGRNGISFQSQAQIIDETGGSIPLKIAGNAPISLVGSAGKAIKTEGTNCAFRRKIFDKTLGFDPVYRYFMDETDLNIRLAHLGCKTAIVPLAQVHHDTAASGYRSASKMPKSLFEIGASTAVFLRKHAPDTDHSEHLKNANASQRKILLRHMIDGNCEPRDIDRLLQTFAAGVSDGQNRPLATPPAIPAPLSGFKPAHPNPSDAKQRTVFGYRVSAACLHETARAAARSGYIVSLYVFSRTALFHRVSYHPDGYWQQIGGLFGRSERSGRLFRATTLSKRTTAENLRIASVRHPWHMPNPTSDVAVKTRYGSL